MQFRRRPRAIAPGPDSSPAPRSAAWLAGESLFQAPPRQAEPAAPVVVTIRRSKRAVQPAEGEGAAPEASSPEWKGPRVFRVETASNETVAEEAPPAPVAVPAKRRPRQRIGVNRRPGPVLVQVFQTEPAADHTPPFHEQQAALETLMAEVSGILADAQHAQALRFIVEA